jgi:hypothetical protein
MVDPSPEAIRALDAYGFVEGDEGYYGRFDPRSNGEHPERWTWESVREGSGFIRTRLIIPENARPVDGVWEDIPYASRGQPPENPREVGKYQIAPLRVQHEWRWPEALVVALLEGCIFGIAEDFGEGEPEVVRFLELGGELP